ncbi:hypothetical protein [Legionella gresilensis]|uniref:hypothetical protein n=1 Tax=Legionella gresilensis TaxID=91823 RepID=UPI00104149CA|nr:hypothetical protein [Legionella gresilensis]
MDNTTFHKALLVRAIIEKDGRILEFLHLFSSDEHNWAQAKAIRRVHHAPLMNPFSVSFYTPFIKA